MRKTDWTAFVGYIAVKYSRIRRLSSKVYGNLRDWSSARHSDCKHDGVGVSNTGAAFRSEILN